MHEVGGPGPVVALVSSAGGVDATVEVLGDLPAELPCSVIVLQHKPPRFESRLHEVLSRMTDRPVGLAVDGGLLHPGAVVVAPPGCHTLVTPQRQVSLIMSGDLPPARPSADLLLTSMALSLGSEAVAVIMSGSGHDGATGATAVHKHGGVVLATDAETSRHFSMPRAAIERDAIVHQVVPTPEVATRLRELVLGWPSRAHLLAP